MEQSLIKAIGKSLALKIPLTRELYFQREFRRTTPSCRGLYASFAEASAAAPREKLSGYDHAEIPELYREHLGELNPADYPVLFWLSQILPGARLVFELGGSIGVGYYSYRKYLPFPPGLRWIVCEVPETVRTGEEIARERNETGLAFTDRREAAENPDIYATFGALQYIEEPFAGIIAGLPARPPHLLLNRVPLGGGRPFITLQNNGRWFSPYKVDNKSEFIDSVCALGYELVDAWEMARPNVFLLPPGHAAPGYHGMYFHRR